MCQSRRGWLGQRWMPWYGMGVAQKNPMENLVQPNFDRPFQLSKLEELGYYGILRRD